MRVWDEVFPEYGLAAHKGYSTPEHCRGHRAYRPHAPAPPEFRTRARAARASPWITPRNGSVRHGGRRMMPPDPRAADRRRAVPRPGRSVPPPVYRWYHKMSAVVFITFCLEIGLFLLIFPWTDYWDGNYFSGLVPADGTDTGTTCTCAAPSAAWAW